MRAQEEFQRAAERARLSADEARDALRTTRAAVAGGPARNAKHAEEQMDALRTSLGRDIASLRARAATFDPRAGGTIPRAALTAAAGVALVVAVGVAASAAGTRHQRRRDLERQAAAPADALRRAQANAASPAPARRGRRAGRHRSARGGRCRRRRTLPPERTPQRARRRRGSVAAGTPGCLNVTTPEPRALSG